MQEPVDSGSESPLTYFQVPSMLQRLEAKHYLPPVLVRRLDMTKSHQLDVLTRGLEGEVGWELSSCCLGGFLPAEMLVISVSSLHLHGC